jgi:hypothetical protein
VGTFAISGGCAVNTHLRTCFSALCFPLTWRLH